ncbi:7-carboxy-7-deazaguanine synthase [Paludibacterium paludis]|uniref:7-carboxy-7-deazaguanine synthase n=1 Tax=Paludibacterium paludis TaxID=1225769 RepID=A0A918P4U6_9NEIS|nr:7-carboxy-7-deazaguanine synthase [Paludibacterium paludis]GGY21662.1 7-carboxy-7-deazaguanine synthase [Paludibacterium paludis]
MYTVKEIFYTLQGEGCQAGRAAVFCRFSGCNLWSGKERHREEAVCRFCDTDFVGTGPDGGKFPNAGELAARIAAQWPADAGGTPYVVCTGGEPLLQLDAPLIDALHRLGFEVAVETNGTLPAPAGLDWICVSPKAGAPLVQRQGHELKLVYPQPALLPDMLGDTDFAHYFVQPMDGPERAENTAAAIDWCMKHPEWRLSVQTHKIVNIR